ncbi:Zinc/iron permease [Jimgerdemannia flammicorona]|uniref:Zinc/iron permease n=1 Tax=Jimgerdemannia flammicorona TaxID=994334 RepID=A0A433PKF8_9FUNG|nr:Zinc/iron permease [Jimgerdemannia flammicorona]
MQLTHTFLVVAGMVLSFMTFEVNAVPPIARLWARQAVVLNDSGVVAPNNGTDACSLQPVKDYNMNLHVASLFIILSTSLLGVFGPMVLHHFRVDDRSTIRDTILMIGKFFGTGIILATAFVHMLPDAFGQFANPCLGGIWSQYGPWAGCFCMISAFLIQAIEFAAITNAENMIEKRRNNSGHSTPTKAEGPLYENPNGHSHHHHGDEDGHFHTAGMLESEDAFKDIGTLILELGITLHSVIIGITLSTTDGPEFISLFVALVFHQFFEGIALGTRINELKHSRILHSFIMGLIYGLMTPLGIALGLAIRSTYNANSSTAIVTVGILDSMSAGILLYNAFVELMSMEMNHNLTFRRKSLATKIFCFLCMYLGALAMALVGVWT